MILEVAILDVKQNQEHNFEKSFSEAQKIIVNMKGYISYKLKKCVETPNRYILLVNWEKLENHTIGFRNSTEYQEWKKLLHHYYDPFPIVEHYHSIYEES